MQPTTKPRANMTLYPTPEVANDVNKIFNEEYHYLTRNAFLNMVIKKGLDALKTKK